MNNNDLGNLNIKRSPQQKQEKDPTDSFDVTRKARQEALESVAAILLRAEDSKIHRKDLVKILRSFYQCSISLDELVILMLKDMYKLLQALAQQEMNLFALRTNMKTLVRALDKKGIINEEELRDIHDNDILPAEIEELKKAAAKK